MQINLKQQEIESALKGYIASQGINLFNKDVNIAFTAGRKGSGLSAEVIIEDAANHANHVVVRGEIAGFVAAQPVTSNTPTPEVAAEVVEEQEPVKTSSLFG